MMKFDLPKDQSSIIKVIGVGGGGSNAVNHMFHEGIQGVDFIVCNTDAQALDMSPVPIKLQLGSSLTEGMGAGSLPEVGRNAAIENIDDIKSYLEKGTKMVFITAGMGGGTGTGAAPVIAQAAKEMGVLTVGIVTVPFSFEGKKRKMQAEAGIENIRKCVDTLLVIRNDRLREMFGNLSLDNAFAQADNVLTSAARGIAEVITVTGKINVDFNDVKTVMTDSGVAIMGTGVSEGEDRAIKAAEQALASPLLNDNDISGAKYVLLNITYGSQEVLMDEISDITDFIQEEAGMTADVIWGHGVDESLGEALSVTVIATSFNSSPDTGILPPNEERKKYIPLDADVPTMITEPIQSPTESVNPVTETIADPESMNAPEEAPEPYLKPMDEEEERNQVSMEFDLSAPAPTPGVPGEPTTIKYNLDDDMPNPVEAAEPQATPQQQPQDSLSAEPELTFEEKQARTEERISRIKELSLKLKTPSGIADLENEPAYKRRQVDLDDVPHSSESQVSRYTLSEEEGEEGQNSATIRPNNPFLHDNVD